MYTVGARTAEDFALVAEHKWTVFVINWHMECTARLKCVSFPSMNVISLCYLSHSFALAVTLLTSVRGEGCLVRISGGAQSSVVVGTSRVFSCIFRDSALFRPGKLASTAFTINYSLVILPHRLSCWRQISDKYINLLPLCFCVGWVVVALMNIFFCFGSTCHGRWTCGCAYEINFWSDIQMYTLRN